MWQVLQEEQCEFVRRASEVRQRAENQSRSMKRGGTLIFLTSCFNTSETTLKQEREHLPGRRFEKLMRLCGLDCPHSWFGAGGLEMTRPEETATFVVENVCCCDWSLVCSSGHRSLSKPVPQWRMLQTLKVRLESACATSDVNP